MEETKKYLMYERVQVVTENTVIPATDYGGWSVVNQGDDPVIVNGIEYSQESKVIGRDIIDIPMNVVYAMPIEIRFKNISQNKRAIIIQRKFVQER